MNEQVKQLLIWIASNSFTQDYCPAPYQTIDSDELIQEIVNVWGLNPMDVTDLMDPYAKELQ